jgi:DNA replication initiation complex subunit (GINS family)
MYKKIVNVFFNELKNDDILNLPDNFYENVREYLGHIKNNENIYSNKEMERIIYYVKELRKLRLNKAFFRKESNIDNLTDEEKKILLLVENITYSTEYGDFNNTRSNTTHVNNNSNSSNNTNNQNHELYRMSDNSLDDYGLFDSKLNKPSIEQYVEPKPINTQNDIDIVRVNTRFPEFTNGKYTYLLNKNDILTLDEKFSKILEKHNIVKKINGE